MFLCRANASVGTRAHPSSAQTVLLRNKTPNIEHPTSNIEHRTGEAREQDDSDHSLIQNHCLAHCFVLIVFGAARRGAANLGRRESLVARTKSDENRKAKRGVIDQVVVFALALLVVVVVVVRRPKVDSRASMGRRFVFLAELSGPTNNSSSVFEGATLERRQPKSLSICR